MKRIWILSSLLIVSFLLAGCECKVTNTVTTEPTTHEYDAATQFCLNNWWTHSYIISKDEEYWECTFPSWVGCRDDIVMTEDCYFLPNLEDVDTEEKRQSWCEKSAENRIIDMVPGAKFDKIIWDENEEISADDEWNTTMISRNFVVKYQKDWSNWEMPATCEASYLDWSLGTTFDQEYIVE